MKTDSPIMKELKCMTLLSFNDESQKAFFRKMYEDAKPVQCVSVKEVFSEEEIQIIKRVVNPKQNQCYRNAALLTELLPHRCKYVEGFGFEFFKLDHAFNLVDGKYIDITFELVLKKDVTKEHYVSLIEANSDEILKDIEEHDNIVGDYWRHQYIKRIIG